MRLAGWESRLAAYTATSAPFAWGVNDCALHAMRWVKDCTGMDCMATWAGRYRSKAGALRMFRLHGFRGVADLASAHLPEIPVTQASRGDLVLHPQGALGICNGQYSHFVGEEGLLIEETLSCPRAWRVDA